MEQEIERRIDEFKKRLFTGRIRDRIVKLCLFGSVAKEGILKKDSDVDLLIVVNDGQKAREEIMDLSFEFQTEYGFPVEPIICSIEDLFPITDYFVYNCLNYGVEVYSMEKNKIKRESCKHLKGLAEEYLEGAANAREEGFFRLAVDAAYNAAELAMKGLILLIEDDLPGSHGGIVGKFGELYVKSGKFERAIGRQLNQSLELRNQARYKFSARIGKEEADSTIKIASFMIGQLALSIKE
ncbi:HEPN domain-containing protein [bacterium]|nr:HEPN domain-containing protein [bacterium]